MVYQERNTWSGLIVMLIVLPAYVVLLLRALAERPASEVDWWPMMAWTIAIGIVATIALSVVWGILAGMRDPDGVGRSDDRDRDIAHMGDRVGQAFLVIAGLGVIVLCAVRSEPFWVAHTMFFGFALSALVGGVAQVIAYRRGLI